MRFVILAAAVLVAAALFVGCGQANDEGTTSTGAPGEGDGTQTTGAEGPSSATPAPPGLYDVEGGRTQALGVLAFRDLEGGFWAVVDAFEGQPSEEAKVVAVIANAEALGVDLESLDGKYVAAEGKLLDGASIRMAGPELEADSLERVEEMTVGGDHE